MPQKIDPAKITNPILIEAINNMRADFTEQTQNKMITAMISGNYIVPVTLEDGEISEEGKPAKGSRITFCLAENKQGEKYMMAFTDLDEAKKWNGEIKETLIINFDEIADLILKQTDLIQGFVINPYSHNVIFPKNIVASIKEQKDKLMPNSRSNQAMLREPAELPEDICGKAIEYFKAHDNIDKAYIQEMLINNRLGYLIAVDFRGIPELVLTELKNYLAETVGKRPLTLISVDSDNGKVVEEHAKAPFYVKGEKSEFAEDKPEKAKKKKGLFSK